MLHYVRQREGLMRNSTIAARIADDERKRLQTYADILDIPESQLLREALKEKLDRLEADPRIAYRVGLLSEVTVAYDA